MGLLEIRKQLEKSNVVMNQLWQAYKNCEKDSTSHSEYIKLTNRVYDSNRDCSRVISELELLIDNPYGVLIPCTICDCEYYDETNEEFCGGEIGLEPAICSCKRYEAASKIIRSTIEQYVIMLLKGHLSHCWIDKDVLPPKDG